MGEEEAQCPGSPREIAGLPRKPSSPATFQGAPLLWPSHKPLPTNEGLREGRRRGDWAGSECWEWMGTYCLDSLGPELCGFLGLPLVCPLPELSCGLALWSQGGAAWPTEIPSYFLAHIPSSTSCSIEKRTACDVPEHRGMEVGSGSSSAPSRHAAVSAALAKAKG